MARFMHQSGRESATYSICPRPPAPTKPNTAAMLYVVFPAVEGVGRELREPDQQRAVEE